MAEANELRKQKHLYIIEHATDDGFDTTRFNQFLAQSRGANFNVDSIDFPTLQQVVAEFQAMKE